MKTKFVKMYADWASRVAQLSYGRRLKVGAVVVKDDIVTFGYNGMPKDWDNNCENKAYMSFDAGGWVDPETIEVQWPFEDEKGRYKLVTKPEVLHAESNAIAKLAKTNLSGAGADIFITHSPCVDCAKLIYQSGINRVYYIDNYKNDDGINFLKSSGVTVSQISNMEDI